MNRFHGKVTLVGGEELEFEAGNAALASWEKYAARNGLKTGKEAPPTISSLLIAHHALGVELGADAWMETVDGIELEFGEKLPDGTVRAAVPPTEPAASTA